LTKALEDKNAEMATMKLQHDSTQATLQAEREQWEKEKAQILKVTRKISPIHRKIRIPQFLNFETDLIQFFKIIPFPFPFPSLLSLPPNFSL
jgi:hypothetical protein